MGDDHPKIHLQGNVGGYQKNSMNNNKFSHTNYFLRKSMF